MARLVSREPDALVIARFLVAAIDAGSKITLREREQDFWIGTPPNEVRALTRTFNSLVADSAPINFLLQHLVTVPEAARLSGYAEADIISRIERGELGGLYTGGAWLVSRSELQLLTILAESERFMKQPGFLQYKQR
jgi:hypothetical protein